MILKRKIFTKWDETDNLKAMKDSDILSQKKKKQNAGRNAANLGGSAITGAIAGGALGSIGGLMNKGSRLKTSGKLGKIGAIGGAAVGLLAGGKKINDQANENAWYNDRLKYAQRQAKRRERKDWKTNMTQRDGYSY